MSKIEYKVALKALLDFIVDIGFSNLVLLILPSMVYIAIPAKSLVVFLLTGSGSKGMCCVWVDM